jgi:hypothetical protein
MKKSLSSKSIFSLGWSRSSRPAGTDSDAAESDMDGLSEIEKARQDIMLAYLEAHSGNDADAPAVERQKSFAEELQETYQAKSEYSQPTEGPAEYPNAPDEAVAGERAVPEVPVANAAEAVAGADNLDIPTGDIAGDAAGYCLSCTTMLCDSQNCFKSEIMKQIVADDIAAHRQLLKKNCLS